MIDSIELVFADAAPNLTDRRLVTLLQEVVGHASWVRWSALILGTFALVGPLTLYLVTWGPRLLGDGAEGRITVAGHIFFALLAALGVIALLFAARLFRDVAPYRTDAETLASMRIERAEITGFGPWLTVGGAYAKYQRLRLRDRSGRALETPYVRLTQAIWLLEGDGAWLAVDPSGTRAPIFLGADRAAPEVVGRAAPVGFREYYQALEAHLGQAEPKRRETLLRVIGASRG